MEHAWTALALTECSRKIEGVCVTSSIDRDQRNGKAKKQESPGSTVLDGLQQLRSLATVCVIFAVLYVLRKFREHVNLDIYCNHP